MRKTFLCLVFGILALAASAQRASVTWTLAQSANLAASTADGEAKSLVTSSYLSGSNVSKVEEMSVSNATEDYEPVVYTPSFSMFYVDTRQTGKVAGHCISFGVTPQSGHTFKPTRLSFDAAKCGTDGGNIDVVIKPSGGTEVTLASAVAPLRNKVDQGNPNGYSHHEYVINDMLVEGKAFIVILYIYNINGTDTSSPKAIAFRNVTVEGMVDEPLFAADHYVTHLGCRD